MRLYNTLSRQIETLVPLNAPKVTLYVCGITPYDECHVGHARCYTVFDVLKRTLRAEGFQVTHAQNYTDVDDKIIERALQKGQDPLTYPEPFIRGFEEKMKLLNVLPADAYPRVTEYLKDGAQSKIVRYIAELEKRGLTYTVEGDVYFDVTKFKDYGKLSRRAPEDLLAGARVEVDPRKRNPQDFALWKTVKPGEPSWESPWGKGRPGWHIECSVMATDRLGQTFDIHGGGMDLIFPHHENEIAQSQGHSGDPKSFARMWVHNGFVTVNKEKMSKSLGNFFTLTEIFEKFDPMAVRYFLLSTHYRSPIDFSDAALTEADAAYQHLKNVFAAALFRCAKESQMSEEQLLRKLEERTEALNGDEIFLAALSEDLNTPQALAELHVTARHLAKGGSGDGTLSALALLRLRAERFLGLRLYQPAASLGAEAESLIKARDEARRKKDWKASDEIRKQLEGRGFKVMDTAQGTRVERK